MKVFMYSRLEELRLVPRDNRRATDRLRDHLYKRHPMRLLIGENEKEDRRFWSYVASKTSRRKRG